MLEFRECFAILKALPFAEVTTMVQQGTLSFFILRRLKTGFLYCLFTSEIVPKEHLCWKKFYKKNPFFESRIEVCFVQIRTHLSCCQIMGFQFPECIPGHINRQIRKIFACPSLFSLTPPTGRFSDVLFYTSIFLKKCKASFSLSN